MKKKYFLSLVVIFLIVLQGFSYRNLKEDNIPFPEEFNTWQVVKANVKDSVSSATFANKEAMIGFNTGVFPDGSKVVFEVWFKKANDDGSKRRKKLDLMVKDLRKYPESKGWVFSHYSGASKQNDVKNIEESMKCYSCHMKEPDNVFAELK